MNKFTASLMAATMIAASLSSCSLSDNSEYKEDKTLSSMINIVYDVESEDTALFSPAAYKLSFNYTEATCDIEIVGLKTQDGHTYPTLKVEGVKWGINSRGWVEIKFDSMIPVGSGAFASVPIISSFRLEMLDRIVQQMYQPIIDLTYTITDQSNGHRFDVRSVPTSFFEDGETKVSGAEGVTFTSHQNNAPFYVISIGTSGKANIYIQNMRFEENTQSVNMRFADVSFTATVSGRYELNFSAENLTPSIINGNTEAPNPDYSVTNLTGSIDVNGGSTFSYTCTAKGKEYRVEFTSKYPERTLAD